MDTIILIFAWALAVIFVAFGAIMIWRIYKWEDISGLICELPKGGQGKGKASLSRFQLLLFTFVIAGLYLILSIEAGQFVELHESTLYLLGISTGSYVISKGVSKSGEDKQNKT